MFKLKLINQLVTSEYCDIVYEKCDNRVAIIQKLGANIRIDPKRLHLYMNEVQLDSNQFIGNNVEFLYYKITGANVTDVIVKIKKNYFGVPKFIQIDKNAKIKYLKDVLSNFNPIDNLSIFLFNENGEMLTDSNTIDSYNIKDKTKITIYIGENLRATFNICDPLMKLNEFKTTQIIKTCEFVMTQTISEVKRKISEIMGIDSDKLFLFTDSCCLRDDKQLIDYPIKNNCNIYGLNFRKSDNLQIERKPFKKGKYANIFVGEFGLPPQRVAVSKFKLNRKSIEEIKPLKYEIITRVKLSCTLLDRFVQLFAMYEEGDFLYIAMDYVKESLKSRYESSEFQPRDIARYASQISDGLGYMHDNFIIHRSLKCSSVLIDEQNNIKLCNFHSSKYLYNCTTNEILRGIPGSKIADNKRWLAPEILAGEPYGLKSDIWSLGATMIEMLTKKPPYWKKNVHRAVQEIVDERTIVYDKSLAPTCNEIIERCIRNFQGDRPTCKEVKELLENIL